MAKNLKNENKKKDTNRIKIKIIEKIKYRG
jgi:hypothetical protein